MTMVGCVAMRAHRVGLGLWRRRCYSFCYCLVEQIDTNIYIPPDWQTAIALQRSSLTLTLFFVSIFTASHRSHHPLPPRLHITSQDETVEKYPRKRTSNSTGCGHSLIASLVLKLPGEGRVHWVLVAGGHSFLMLRR
jgi:hypothetical protein